MREIKKHQKAKKNNIIIFSYQFDAYQQSG